MNDLVDFDSSNHFASARLFVCGTPLQALIIEKIIELEGLSPSQCILFFYSYVKSQKYASYYERIKPLFSQAIYFYCDNNYPGYAIDSRRIFRRLRYEGVYLASVTSSFVLLALSAGKHEYIVTFDDGTANIFSTSTYAGKYGLSFKKFVGLAMLGNRYYIQRIRNESERHYTLYPDCANNISKKLIPLSLFPAGSNSRSEKSCSVVLGTVFREVFDGSQIGTTIAKLSKFVGGLGSNAYYIPHPRSSHKSLSGCVTIGEEKISEEVIGDLTKEYKCVNVYGFFSSTQFNLVGVSGIRQYFLLTSHSRFMIEDIAPDFEVFGIGPEAMIDLDAYLEI